MTSSSDASYSSSSIKKLVSDLQNSSTLFLDTFLAHRRKEIIELQRSVNEKKQGSTRTYQKLPRYQRRRIMGYNIHVLPKNLRKSAQREYQLSNRVKQRKRRKVRRRRAIQNYMNVANTNPIEELCTGKKEKRLVTHIFHAKRMRMVPRWGFRIAIESVHKIYRVSYRYLRQHCTMHDASYLICLQLNSTSKESILQTLRQLSGDAYSSFQQKFIADGVREGSFVMYLPNTSQEYQNSSTICLGPVKFIWKQSSSTNNSSCMCWIHPASLPQSFEVIKSIATKNNVEIVYRNDIVRIELRGPNSTSVLNAEQNLSLSLSQTPIESLRIWKSITSSKEMSRPGYQPSNIVIGLRVRHPLVRVSVIEVVSNEVSNMTLLQLPLTEPPQKIALVDDLWTHITSLGNSKRISFPVLLIQHPSSSSNGIGEGWDVITTSDIGVHLFAKFAKTKNVLVLPLSDRNRLLSEQGIPVFPNDYPDSNAYLTELQSYQGAAKQQLRKIKLLKQNRWDESHNRVHTIIPSWNALQQPQDKLFIIQRNHKLLDKRNGTLITQVHVTLMQRGVPSPGYTLFNIKSGIESILNNPHKSIPFNQIESNLEKIGFLTTGISSLIRGKGFGIGFCIDSKLQELKEKQSQHKLPKNSILLLMLDHSNQMLYPAMVVQA